jgi:hypothetical protein
MKTPYLLTVFLVGALFCISRPATAQQSGTMAGVPMRMTVTVEPKKGTDIPAITRQDIVVTQGHNKRQVTDWVPASGNNAGLALAVLIDDSAGFSLGSQLSDIRSFIQSQAPTTLVAVGYMQNGTIALTQNFTNNHMAAAKSVRLAQGYFGAEASPYLSISDFIKRWPVDPKIPRREILAITSGIDTVYMGAYPNPYADATIKDAQCGSVQVYSIYTPSAGHFGHSYFRTYWGQNYLSEISEDTGGESFYFLGPQALVSFAPYLDKMNRQLSHQFLMTFLAEPQKKAGQEPVNITSEIHSVDFLHANRVCVPASPGQ